MSNHSKYILFQSVVDEIVDQVQSLAGTGYIKQSKKVTGKELIKLEYSVTNLVRDSVSIRLSSKSKPSAAIDLNSNRYTANQYQKQLSYKIHIQRAFHGMIALGYLRVTSKGYYGDEGNNLRTRYAATQKLLSKFEAIDRRILPTIIPPEEDSEVIRVQVKKEVIENNKKIKPKVLQPYTDTEQTQLMRANLEKINNCLKANHLDLKYDDQSIDQIQKEMSSTSQQDAGVDQQIRFNQVTLRRIFNDSEFKTGGRFYGGWWQSIPKKYRSRLLINGKSTVEYDYSNLHPTILYLREGLEPPVDAYSDIIPDVKAWILPPEKVMRGAVKKALNAMLNAGKPMIRPPHGFRKKTCNCTWKQLSSAILKKHKPIAHHFFSNVGVHLQRIDSDIAEIVMLKFAEMGYPVLPLHDSFILHNGLESVLKKVMREAFDEVVGGQVGIDKKEPKSLISTRSTAAFWLEKIEQEELEKRSDEFTTKNPEELLSWLDVGHELRLEEYFRSKSG